MGKRGPKPKGKVKIKWSADFAYAIGLIATDGCVSNDGRHITFVSKDKEQIDNYIKCLKISNKVGVSYSGYKRSRAYRIQFGDVNFIAFLKGIGIGPAKSLIMGPLNIPDEYFFDFLRGCLDGDGYSHSYWDKRWRSSFLLYVGFVSASTSFIYWLKRQIRDLAGVEGHITRAYKKRKYYQLKYSKYDAIKLIRKLYSNDDCVCLTRKRLKIKRSLAMIDLFPSEDRYLTKDARVAKLAIRTTLRW
jgi:hypothetical protein